MTLVTFNKIFLFINNLEYAIKIRKKISIHFKAFE